MFIILEYLQQSKLYLDIWNNLSSNQNYVFGTHYQNFTSIHSIKLFYDSKFKIYLRYAWLVFKFQKSHKSIEI